MIYIRGKVKHELRVQIYELQVPIYELRVSNPRVTSSNRLVNVSFIRSNLEVPTFPRQHGFKKSLCDHYVTIIFWQLGNLEALIQIDSR